MTLFGIIFSLLLSYAFGSSTDGVYIHTRTDGKLVNVARLRTNTKDKTVLVFGVLFADESALATHSEAALPLRRLINKFASEFGLTVSLKKTNVSAKNVRHAPEIKIGGDTLEVVDEFTYLGSTNSMILSVGSKFNSPEEWADPTVPCPN